MPAYLPIELALDKDISRAGLCVYNAISSVQGRAASCKPSISVLCRRSGYGRSYVMESIKALEAKGWITREKRPGQTSVLAVVLDRQDKCKVQRYEFIPSASIHTQNFRK